MKQEDKELVYNYLMIVGLLMIFIAGGIALYELLGAKRYCNSIEGSYDINFFPLEHLCNGKPIFQYSEGWNFDREISLTINFP